MNGCGLKWAKCPFLPGTWLRQGFIGLRGTRTTSDSWEDATIRPCVPVKLKQELVSRNNTHSPPISVCVCERERNRKRARQSSCARAAAAWRCRLHQTSNLPSETSVSMLLELQTTITDFRLALPQRPVPEGIQNSATSSAHSPKNKSIPRAPASPQQLFSFRANLSIVAFYL